MRGLGASFLLVSLGLERQLAKTKGAVRGSTGGESNMTGKDKELIDAALQVGTGLTAA